MGILSTATAALQSLLSGETGIAWALGNGSSATGSNLDLPIEIRTENVSAEIAEKGLVRYPMITLYCDRLTSSGREKFANISVSLNVTAELRVSGNNIASVSEQSMAYTEAILAVLDCHKGVWAPGIQYLGGYDVTFQQMKKGGSQLLQITKIAMPLKAYDCQ